MNYQNAIALLWQESVRIWTPPPKLNLVDWMDHYYYIPAGDPSAGKWRTLPYQKGPAQAMTDPKVQKITFMKSARIGYTRLITGLIGYYTHQNPRNVLMVQPTIEDAQGYSKDEITGLFRDTPILEAIAPEQKTRDPKHTILRKEFPGMTLWIVGANSARGFRRISAGTVIFDEVDGYPPSAGQEGDQITLGSRRAEYYWDKKIILGSTPTDRGASRIEESFLESDMRKYFIPCPFCKTMQTIEWSNIDFSNKGTIKKPVLICTGCGKPIDYSHHRWMIENGEWRADSEFKGHAGFYLWAAYSYSPNATWAHIVEEFLSCKDNKLKLKGFVNTWLGQTWEEEADTIQTDIIYDRREDYGIVVPEQAAIITAAVDTQDDRLEVSVGAWGPNEEDWGLEHIIINGDPGRPEIWERLDAYLMKSFPLAGTGEAIPIHCTMIDRGGHHADRVDAFVRTRASRNIFAIQGRALADKPLITRPTLKNKGKIRLYTVNTDAAKNILMARLKMVAPGPGYVHLNKNFSKEFCDQLAAESRKKKFKRGFPYYVWEKKAGVRNEGLDLSVYRLAALRAMFPAIDMLNNYIAKTITNRKPKPVDQDEDSFPDAIKGSGKRPTKKTKGGFVTGWKK